MIRVKKFMASGNRPYIEIQGFRPTLPKDDYEAIKKYAANSEMSVDDYLFFVFKTGLTSAFEGEHIFETDEDEE